MCAVANLDQVIFALGVSLHMKMCMRTIYPYYQCIMYSFYLLTMRLTQIRLDKIGNYDYLSDCVCVATMATNSAG